jgi:hypothetical protein
MAGVVQQGQLLCPSSSLGDYIDFSMQNNIMHIYISYKMVPSLHFQQKSFSSFLVFPSKPWNDVLHELEECSSKRLTGQTMVKEKIFYGLVCL